MPSFNKVILAGNITRDIEQRFTPRGTATAQFGIAVNRKWTAESGEKNEDVCFVDCTVFGKQAETLVKYVVKGDPLLIEGRLDLDEWEDKETKKNRQKLFVVVEGFQFLKSKDKQ